MRISSSFSRFYLGAILGDLYEQMIQRKRIIMSLDKFKDALKYANKDYPRYANTNDTVSTKDINSKDLTDHLEWIRRYASHYGLTLKTDDEEWERMMADIRETE